MWNNKIYIAIIVVLIGAFVTEVALSNSRINELTGSTETLKAENTKLGDELLRMKKLYNEMSEENTAFVNYLAEKPVKMDFAHPFGFSLRKRIDKSRLLPNMSYIKDGNYEDYETGEMLVDRDTMAFAKISGRYEGKEQIKNLEKTAKVLEKRVKADVAAAKYPFAVSSRVWVESDTLNFEICDVEMLKKMDKREQLSREKGDEVLRKYRNK